MIAREGGNPFPAAVALAHPPALTSATAARPRATRTDSGRLVALIDRKRTTSQAKKVACAERYLDISPWELRIA
ncbi:uncharacterized protein LAESUDRAFT_756758 [Laetiporus sulphureus 93-53]|uniref:Uncharacterized protein n=1 Tax=Laetiporus sulphureus 93-53 TaxID=1314785 RepID=A0A165FKM3_9APHY|nr:uncharacterized protein LAESUDRAFT_756758 [Laetiporus sulphureus 93-53]KZT09115.1 hypothetical protein LAESUDRAFT_756758 [Laetiporus sulphureus 93-53]